MTTILIFEHYEDVKSTYHGIFMRDASIWLMCIREFVKISISNCQL